MLASTGHSHLDHPAGFFRMKLMIEDITPRETVTLVGWGAEKDPEGSPQDILQAVTLNEFSLGECKRERTPPEYQLKHPFIQIRDNSSFCLHNEQASPCYVSVASHLSYLY